MARLRDFHRQRCRQVVGFITARHPARDASLLEGGTQSRHLIVQFVWHGWATGFVVREALMTPAAAPRFIIKHRYGVGRLAVDNQLIKRVQTGLHAG